MTNTEVQKELTVSEEVNTNTTQPETQTTNSTNDVPKKSKSKKIIMFVAIGLIVGFIVLCGGAAGVFYYISLQQTKGLKKKENSRLTFYYPENYVADNAESGEFVFINQEKNKFGGNSSIRTMDSESLKGSDKIKDKDTCQKFAEGNLESSSNESDPLSPKADAVEYTEFAGIRTCVFGMSYDAKDFGKEGKVKLKVKIVIKDGDQDAVVASYDDNTSDEEKDRLNRSINLFAFK